MDIVLCLCVCLRFLKNSPPGALSIMIAPMAPYRLHLLHLELFTFRIFHVKLLPCCLINMQPKALWLTAAWVLWYWILIALMALQGFRSLLVYTSPMLNSLTAFPDCSNSRSVTLSHYCSIGAVLTYYLWIIILFDSSFIQYLCESCIFCASFISLFKQNPAKGGRNA